jgi:hypothetical protein
MSDRPSTRFGFYCSCGAAMHGQLAPAVDIPELERLFRRVHQGPGHAPSDARGAARARRNQERARRLAEIRDAR